uniref:Uncharacterized protein n=1 Tax=White spot syndrome virus TaxID=342409 RepID=A0A6B9MDK4_9VIRU|nr:hypothetical protein [White spot syndrome virus]WOG35310.1 hypothetical protein [White spot syndrome virus]
MILVFIVYKIKNKVCRYLLFDSSFTYIEEVDKNRRYGF